MECLIPRLGWNSYLGSILRLGWNNYLDGTTTWVRTCVLRPLGHSLYQLSYVEHLLIHPGEANGPNSNTAPLPGGRRVHLGSVCWVGRWCAMSCRHSPRGVGGRASGGSSLLVSRAAEAKQASWPCGVQASRGQSPRRQWTDANSLET